MKQILIHSIRKKICKGLVFGFLLSFFSVNISVAQSKTSANEVRFMNIESSFENDMIYISFDVELHGRFITSGDALHIVPVYRTINDEISFPEILINGKKRASYYRREQSLLSRRKKQTIKPFTEIVHDDKIEQRISYSFSLPVPANMDRVGTLHIDQYLQGCCDIALVDAILLPVGYTPNVSSQDSPKVNSHVIGTMFSNTISFIVPEAEIVKKRNENIVVSIEFPVSKSEVLPNFANNQYEIDSVDKQLRTLFTDQQTYQITDIVIKGYTSPEGSYEENLILSHRRTETFKNFLINKYGFKELNKFYIEGLGEDWQGLRKAVELSNMEYKAEVLRIIDTVGIFEGREKKLMDLVIGIPYRYMLAVMFPSLRRMEMEINYTVSAFDSKQAETAIKDRPDGLSQREIFDLAQSKEDYNLLKVAAQYFPDDATANINAASVDLLNENMEEAWVYLSKVQNNPEAYNNLGIYFWLKGDMKKAESYFQKAVTESSQKKNAVTNLKLLEEYLMQ